MREAMISMAGRAGLAEPLRRRVQQIRTAGLLLRPRRAAACTRAYVLDRAARKRYTTLSEAELRASRTSDTVFVIGAGRSLRDIDAATWERIGGHDTLSFSEFFRESWLAPRYHMIGELTNVTQAGADLAANPNFSETILLVQEGWRAQTGNELLGRQLVPAGTTVFRYRRTARGRYAPPSRSFARGVVHGFNSSTSAANLAILSGWTRIVMTGIDLYNKEYFWMPPGVALPEEHEGLTASSPFPAAGEIVDLFGRWRGLLEPEGVRLEVYNPRSLLAEALEVFSWDTGR